MITGISSSVVCLALWFSFYSKSPFDTVAWITLTISTGIGVIIALIVDDKSTKSHQEVIKSQGTITELLSRLDSTNKKHEETLKMLDAGRIKNETAAIITITKNWDYIQAYLGTVLNAIDNTSPTLKQKKELISKTVQHIESPINIIEQTVQNTGLRLSEKQQKTMLSLTSVMRKIIILATLDLDSKIDEIISDLRTTKQKIDDLINDVNPAQA